MSPSIIDAHIHLWPKSAANATSHGWMKSNDHLAKQYSIENYLVSAQSHQVNPNVKGFVYVETDRRLEEALQTNIAQYAAEPLEEIKFLRRIVEGRSAGREGFDANHSVLLKGIVPWAPLHRPLHDLVWYMTIAKETAGPTTWERVKGFRYLLQGMKNREDFRRLLEPASSSFVEHLRFLGTRNLSFDVGVDQRQGGVWQLEYLAEAIELAHKDVKHEDKTIFILNHLCKPNMEQDPQETERTREDFRRWQAAISRMAKEDRIYMKLSGAFSELMDQDPCKPLDVDTIVQRIQPWTDHVFHEFGPWRIMFGSDWPVCNVRGPGDERSWSLWVEVVHQIMQIQNLSDIEQARIWHGTATEAYRLAPS